MRAENTWYFREDTWFHFPGQAQIAAMLANSYRVAGGMNISIASVYSQALLVPTTANELV